MADRLSQWQGPALWREGWPLPPRSSGILHRGRTTQERSMNRLDGPVAIVTGAGRGIGASLARIMAAEGCAVVVNDLGVTLAGTGQDPRPAGCR